MSKVILHLVCILFVFVTYNKAVAQHTIQLNATLNEKEHTIDIRQNLTYFNQSSDTLTYILLNDWNHSFSSNQTNLAQRFSDEFITSFYFSRKNQKGHTIIDSLSNNILKWNRPHDKTDIVKLYLKKPLLPNQKRNIHIKYQLKLPEDKFTKYGYNNNGYNLKEWYLFPCRYSNHKFDAYSNLNLDDATSAISNYNITLNCSNQYTINSDFNSQLIKSKEDINTYLLTGKRRLNAKIVLEKKNTYKTYPTNKTRVITNIKETRVDTIQRKLIIEKVVGFVDHNIGVYPFDTLLINHTDYSRNPLYGLNQLPSFINPFADDFQYEIKFLKTYLNIFLKNTLQIDHRKDEWLFDAFQMYYIKKYIDLHYPKITSLGDLSKLKIGKGYHLANLSYNDQYHLLYLYMARKNKDQAIGLSKDKLIRFNDKITGKYKAGLSLHYLNAYLEDQTVEKSIATFYNKNLTKTTNRQDFKSIIEKNASKDTRWYFEHLIDKRNIIDYSIDNVQKKANDSIRFTITNHTNNTVPIPLYGLSNNKVVFKKWFPKIVSDSTFTIPGKKADQLILNYNKEAVEFNMRNNYKNINQNYNHRPIKFIFFTDIEEPSRKQIFYVPIADYNLYNGVYVGMRLHNKSLILKNTRLSASPYYSFLTKDLVGSASFSHNFNFRDQKLFLIRYFISGSQYDYAANAKYSKLNTTLNFFFRNPSLRDNYIESLRAKYIVIDREKSEIIQKDDEEELVNYKIFSLNYGVSKRELLSDKGFNTDLQISEKFGKITAQFRYKYLFKTNQQFQIRLFAGGFLYRNLDTNYFDFATDRPTDYLFQYNYYGRSEDSGIYSQQLIIAEGGFKSKLSIPYANEWITTANLGMTIYNWIEMYGDVGFVKNKGTNPVFLYDSGIKLNLVPDFFELYLPLRSSNGWEIAQPNYNEKIRFVVTLSPQTILRLYTRKWF